MKVYVITMYRYGDQESHSYVYGVEEELKTAIKVAIKEEKNRGGKYEAEICELKIGKPGKRKVVRQIYSQKMGQPKTFTYRLLEKLKMLQ